MLPFKNVLDEAKNIMSIIKLNELIQQFKLF